MTTESENQSLGKGDSVYLADGESYSSTTEPLCWVKAYADTVIASITEPAATGASGWAGKTLRAGDVILGEITQIELTTGWVKGLKRKK